jgi:magnesium transporter
MQTIIAYNQQEMKEKGTGEDIKRGYNVWIDLVDPTEKEIQEIQELYSLDEKAIETMVNKSKKPQVRILEDHSFTVILDIKYKDLQTLITDSIYLFLSSTENWLITIHSSDVDLKRDIVRLLEIKNKKIMGASIDALYYSIIAQIVDRYERLLTAIELTITDFEQRTLYRPTKKMLEYLDTLSRQIIVLRRHFWHIRNNLNFLLHMNDKEEALRRQGEGEGERERNQQINKRKQENQKESARQYIEMAYDNITELIQVVESYRDTINSTRELYMANVSLQMNDTMRILAIFSSILLPLTFIVGIFGMNGLDLNDISSIPLGFAIVLLTMIGVAIVLLLFFKKKQWIFAKHEDINESKLISKNSKK